MMPNISGESYAAPGKALASLGNAIGNLGESIAGELNKEDTFRDQLAIHKFDNEESIRQLQSFENFNRDDPNGFAIQQHTERQQRFNNMQASLRTDGGRKKALMYWETTGHNKYERDTSFEYGKRHEVIAKGTEDAVASEYSKIDFSADPETVLESIKASQRNSSAIISSATLPKKDALYEKSKEHFINSLKRAYMDETGAIKPDFYEVVPKLLEEFGGSTLPPKQGQPGQVGPQSSLPSNPRDFLKTRLAKGYESRTGDIDGLNEAMTDRLAAFTKAAQDAGHDISIVSGHRSQERQAKLWEDAVKKYGSPNAARMFVAPPGGSTHQSGEAVDLQYGDRGPGLGGKRTAAVEWAHKNAERFGLNFPLGHEDWHVEPAEARSGGKRFGGQYDTSKRYWQGGSAVAATSVSGGIEPKLTAYSPQAGGPLTKMEGGYAAARPGPDGKAEVRTLEDYAAGKSEYITIAGDPSQNGKSYIIPEIQWIDKAGQLQKSTNVKAVVHDTGSAFKGKGESRFDIPVAKDMTDAQMNAQPFLKGKMRLIPADQVQSAAAQPTKHNGILTSLDDAPTPQEIRSSGASVLDIDVSKPGAKLAVREAKQNGMKVAAYHEGAGGGASWGEDSRDLTKPAELSKLQEDAKALAKSGADYLHVDNLHDLKPDQLAKVAQAVKDAGLTMIGKNNPQGWLDVIQKNPDLKPPYVVIEHGMKDKATLDAAKKLADAGVPVHFVEFGDPGIDMATKQPRKDPVSTADEAKAFADANPWATVTHMRTQDSYNGRESAGAKTFRAQNTIPGAPVQVADASGRIPASAGGNIDPAALKIREYLINHQDEFAKAKAIAEMRVVGDASSQIDQIIKHAESGGDVGNKLVDDITDKLFKMNPALVAKFGLEEKLTAALDFVDEANQYKLLNLQQQETVLGMRRKALAANLDKLPMAAVEAETQALKRFEALHNNAKEGMKKDLLTWAEKVGVQEVPEANWGDPASILQRVNDAKAIADHFGVEPQYFKEGDKQFLTERLKAGGKPMLGMLGGLAQGFGPNLLEAMGQISKRAPEAAVIGSLMARGVNVGVAEDIAIGLERQNKRSMGEKNVAPIHSADSQKYFLDTVGTAFTRMPETEGALKEATDAAVEARAQRKGIDPKDKTKLEALWKQTFMEVLGQTTDAQGNIYGGIVKQGSGHNAVLPSYLKNTSGWVSGNTLTSLLEALRPEDLIDPFGKGPTSGKGTPLSMGALRRGYFVSTDAARGKYFIALGDPTGEDPMFVQDGTGKNFVLDIDSLKDKLRSRRPELFQGYVNPVWGSPLDKGNPTPFTGDFAHGSEVMASVDKVAPKGYQPGPEQSTNVIDERPSAVYSDRRNAQPPRQSNQIPMPTSDQTPEQLKSLLPQ